MNRISRRSFVTTLSGVGALGSISGCFGTNDDPGVNDSIRPDPNKWPDLTGHKVHILSSESSVGFKEYWTEVTNAFERATGATVTMEYRGIGVGYRERISQLVAAGDPPEISHMGANDAATYATAGLLADHTEIVDHWEDIWGETAGDMRVDLGDGDIYVPMLSNPHTTWYREDVIGDPPSTWDEELELAAELDEGRTGTRATSIPLSEGFAGQNKFLSYGWSNGAQVCARDADGSIEVVMDGAFLEEWVEVCEHYQQLYEYCDPGEDIGTGEYIHSVANEFAYWNQYVGARSKLAGEGTDVGKHIAPAHPPYKETERLYGNVQGHAVFADSDVEAGTEFLKFMAEPEHLMGFYFADPIHNAPVYDAIHDHELYQQGLESLPEYWNVPAHLNFDWIPNGIDVATEVDGLNPYAGDLLNSFELFGVTYDLLAKEMKPEAALSNRASRLQEIIDEEERTNVPEGARN